MPPPGLERGYPYLRSPRMGDPMAASWQRICVVPARFEFNFQQVVTVRGAYHL
jgi:hypothetical protein